MIRITAKVDGFRRAGVAHPATPTDHPDDTFTEAQLTALQDEPMLVVEVVTDEKAGETSSTVKPARAGTKQQKGGV
ncbi:HI1506-related protein [Gulbenkiania mobilis]|uniref:HI1506-related protein n=1 Tax=Gulbenkiania mobilis TaxID=397457 RepID=UPI00128F4944|nr:HI1506-related protein [Gulbenkiania mobilis]